MKLVKLDQSERGNACEQLKDRIKIERIDGAHREAAIIAPHRLPHFNGLDGVLSLTDRVSEYHSAFVHSFMVKFPMRLEWIWLRLCRLRE
ncbi:hypothetical protein JCM19239_1365 [Vibrio variabilis]|uniref:Uncharacterized protein n=1 Tax=Vibrio variabilis TaxID=990271 RepID=A0ABQ0JR51_9VIBR|nr:hypothetical protein JCM19239_1365 [Vibrio variabilis]